MNSYHKNAMSTTILGAALLLTACGSSMSSPKQVAETNPSVSYKYKNDEDLIEANQLAITYCQKYDSIPLTSQFEIKSSRDKTVYFECVAKSSQVNPLPAYSPNLSFTYSTDQELMTAARNAQIYCMNNGSRQAFSNIVTNADGSRTVVFQCSAQ